MIKFALIVILGAATIFGISSSMVNSLNDASNQRQQVILEIQ